MTTNIIYGICCPETGHIVYVGKTKDLKARIRGHKKESRRLSNDKSIWFKQKIENGHNPEFIKLDEVLANEADFWESHYISLYRSFNMCHLNRTSGGSKGFNNHPDVIKKYRVARAGRKMSEKFKSDTSQRMMGNKFATGSTHRRKPVYCIDLIRSVVTYYVSGTAAAKELNLKRNCINNNALGLSKIVANRYVFGYDYNK